MSTPRTLVLPDVVEVGTLDGFAVHRVPRAGAPQVLLVPGWTGSKEDFDPVLPLLADAGFGVTAYDQRGQLDTPGRGPYSLESFAADALALIGALDDGSGVHVLGHSFGGLVAGRAALAEPSRFRTLSLLCTGTAGLGDAPRRPLSVLVDALDAGTPLAEIYPRIGRSKATDPEIVAWVEHKFVASDPASLRAMTAELRDAPDVLPALASLGLPVWCGRGEDDDAWPHDVQAANATALGTTIHVVPDSAHSPAVENPTALVAAWLPFLRQH